MRTVPVDEATYQAIALAAKVSNIPLDRVVAMGVAALAETSQDVAAVADPRVPVYSNYGRQRTDALLDLRTRSMTITSGSLAGKAFDSPSAAARAVVRELNPARQEPRTNGWRFWRDAETRRLIEIHR